MKKRIFFFLILLFLFLSISAEENESSEDVIEIEEDESEIEVQENKSDSSPIEVEVEEEVVVDADKMTEKEKSITVEKKTIVSKEEIQESGAKNLGEAMSNQLGIQVSKNAYSNRGAPQGIQIQGCEPSRVLILIDGKKVIGNSDGIVDASQLPLEDVERIEIIKGSSSALYGSDAICGVVNIITKTSFNRKSFGGKAEYGSHQTRQVAANFQTPINKKTFIKLDANYFGTEGYDMDESDKATDGDIINSVKTAASLGFRSAEKWRIDLDGDFYYEDKEKISSYTKGNNLKEYYSTLNREVYRTGGALSFNYNFNETDMLQLKLYDNYFKRNSTDDLQKSPEISERETDNNFYNASFNARILFGTWNLLYGGISFDSEWLDDKKNETKIVDASTSETEKKSNIDNKTLWNSAVFIQDEMIPTDWMTIVPGVRFSYSEKFDYMFTPKLSLKFLVNDDFTINASYGMGYKTPTLKHLYYTFEHTVFGNIIGVNGNPDLKPETSHSFNLGFELIPYGKKSLISLNGYYNIYKDFIDIDYSDPEWVGSNSYYTYKNISEARTYGLESGFKFPFLDYFTLSGGYVLLFAENLDDETDLPHRPKHQVKTELKFHSKNLGLTALLSGMYQSKVYTNNENTIISSQFFLLNAYLEKNFNDWLRFYLRGSNITNVKRDPDDTNDMRPQPGIELFGGIVWNYSWNRKKEK